MKRRILLFVIDGGPCSYKSTGIPHIAKALRAKGYIVLTVPEAATILKTGGMSPENLGSLEFQGPNYELQVAMEAIWLKYAEQLSEKENKDAIVLCDRGRLSGAAYVEDLHGLLLSQYGVQAETILKEYVGVLHMVTAADGAEEFYTCANNEARTESPGLARYLDARSRNAWKGHANMRVVANVRENGEKISGDEKLELAVEAVFSMITGMVKDESDEGIENEAKAALTKEEYERLIAYFHCTPEQNKKQVNTFYDTEDLRLNEIDVTLRTREKKGEYELTIKRNASEGGRLETNHRPLTNSQRTVLSSEGMVPLGNVADALISLGIDGPFLHQGDLCTYRTEIPYEGNKLALDHNLYLNVVDYEIEMERDAPDADEKKSLVELLEKLNISYRPSIGKRKRFFRQKEAAETV